MERNALIVYLRELRDLEIAHRKLPNLIEKEKCSYQRRYDELNAITTYGVPEEMSAVSGLGVFFFSGALLFFLFCPSGEWRWGFGFFCVFCGIVASLIKYNQYSLYKEELVEANRRNKEERNKYEENEEKRQQIINDWDRRYEFLSKEDEKVCSLLKKYYAINIIPSQYRNLESLYYIYEYMSSSQASLEDTLIHEHMENGIQRILAKLDYIISQNQEIIFQNRIMEANSQQIIDKTNAMLGSLERIEQDAGSAAQYAQLSACYNEANAYFSLATYLNGK